MIENKLNSGTIIRWSIFGFIVYFLWAIGDAIYGFHDHMPSLVSGLVPTYTVILGVIVLESGRLKERLTSKKPLTMVRMFSGLGGGLIGLVFALSINQYF